VLDRLRDGTLLEPLGPARDAGSVTWVQVRAPGDATGWVAASFLDIVAAAPTAPARPVDPATPARPDRLPQPDAASVSYRVNADDVRLRKRPGTGANAPILTVLRSGTVVEDDGGEVVNASGFDWRRVRVDGRAGWIATQLLSPVTASRFPFEADTPTELQAQDWTCSIRSVMWMLKSIGVPVTPAEAQDAMSPRYVNSDVGLLDASGAGVVAVLRDRWGVEAFNRAPVSFDEVAGWAGTCPVAIGGRNWGHWTAVRGFMGDRLVLANPGGTGPRFGQQTLSRQQFADLGWFSAVVIPIE
jgi:SH3-like domain-containing protein